MSEPQRSRLDSLLVRVHRIEGEIIGEVFVREPSGADLVKIARLQESLKAAGVTKTPSYLALPLLLCSDATGSAKFGDYDEGLKFVEALQPAALGELLPLVLEATGLEKLTIEAAQKKS